MLEIVSTLRRLLRNVFLKANEKYRNKCFSSFRLGYVICFVFAEVREWWSPHSRMYSLIVDTSHWCLRFTRIDA